MAVSAQWIQQRHSSNTVWPTLQVNGVEWNQLNTTSTMNLSMHSWIHVDWDPFQAYVSFMPDGILVYENESMWSVLVDVVVVFVKIVFLFWCWDWFVHVMCFSDFKSVSSKRNADKFGFSWNVTPNAARIRWLVYNQILSVCAQICSYSQRNLGPFELPCTVFHLAVSFFRWNKWKISLK